MFLLLTALVSTAEAQIDWGIYGIQQLIDGTWTGVGWLEVHDHTNGNVVERHEHWYVNGSWDPDAPKTRFRYNQPSLGHGNRPVSTVVTHFGFLIVEESPDTDGTDPGGSYAGCGGSQHLCPTFYTMKNGVGTTVGYVNVWSADGQAQEMYMLHPDDYYEPSSAVCDATWELVPSSGALTPPGSEPAVRLRKSGTSDWTFLRARRDAGAAGSVGGTYVAPDAPPSCP